MHILIFEDENYLNFNPLSLTRHLSDIYIGGLTTLEKIKLIIDVNRHLQDNVEIYLLGRAYLKGYAENELRIEYISNIDINDLIIGINSLICGNLVDINQFINKLIQSKNSIFVDSNNCLLGFNISNAKYIETLQKVVKNGIINSKLMLKKFKGILNLISFRGAHNGIKTLRYIWELIISMDKLLHEDIREIYKLRYDEYKNLGNNVYIHKDAVIEDLVHFKPPILINENAEVEGLTCIYGPSIIRENSKVLSGAKIVGSVVGRVVKVGSEISSSVIDNYSNVAHTGYVGHSYIGRWVNIGALTVFSDLKNTYGSIKVMVNDEVFDTKLIKLGSFVADYAKLSINTSIYCGKSIGVSSFIHALTTMNIPSFTIWTGREIITLDVEEAIKVQRRMFKRRNIIQREYHIKLLRDVYKLTEAERNRVSAVKKRINSKYFSITYH